MVSANGHKSAGRHASASRCRARSSRERGTHLPPVLLRAVCCVRAILTLGIRGSVLQVVMGDPCTARERQEAGGPFHFGRALSFGANPGFQAALPSLRLQPLHAAAAAQRRQPAAARCRRWGSPSSAAQTAVGAAAGHRHQPR